jgi:hypothetical protein
LSDSQEKEQFSITMLILSNPLLKTGVRCHQLTLSAPSILPRLFQITQFQL